MMEDLKIIKWFKSTDERYRRLTELQKKDVLTPEEEWIYDADLKYFRDKINQLRYAAEKALDAFPDIIQAITGMSEYEILME